MAFTLQLLHASDLEGGVDAIDRAPNFAALAEFFQAQMPNETLIVSAGDNYIPGPFFNAASLNDLAPSLAAAANNTPLLLNGQLVTLSSGVDVDGDGINDTFTPEVNEFGSGLEAGSGRVDISIMNLIGFDAATIGNHELDAGPGQFSEIIAFDPGGSPAGGDPSALGGVDWIGTQFPYLSANLDFSQQNDLSGLFTAEIQSTDSFRSDLNAVVGGGSTPPKIAPATIAMVDGNQVGIIGATTQLLETITSTGNVTVIGDPSGNDVAQLASVIQPVIDQLEAQGINNIILSTHLQQISLEQQLATLLDGVDIIIAGGSDTLLADSDDVARGLQPGQTPDGTYPIVTADAAGDPVVIVSTDGEYSILGRLVVTFDDAGNIQTDSIDPAVSGSFASTDSVVTQVVGDAAFAEGSVAQQVRDLTTAVEGVVNAQDSVTFGLTNVFLDGRRSEVRTEETNLGDLTADANLRLAQSIDPSVQVSIKNGGGIRAQIGEVENVGNTTTLLPPQANAESGKATGEISQLDIVNSLRFNNALTLQTVTATQLKALLENGVSDAGGGNTPGAFPQVGGLQFAFDPTLPSGSRVTSISLLDDSGGVTSTIVDDGQVIGDGTQAIRLVTLNFLADGGDAYPFDTFLQADPIFANRVDLLGETDEDLNLNGTIDAAPAIEDGQATFATPGSEQDALAEFLASEFATTAFASEETDPTADTRIQNLTLRDDTADGSTAPEGGIAARFYNSQKGDHVTVTLTAERSAILEQGDWALETVTFRTPADGTSGATEVYRLFDPNTVIHRFAVGQEAADAIANNTNFLIEGVAFNAFTEGGDNRVAVQEFFNTVTGDYLLSTDTAEITTLQNASGFEDMGILFYGLA